MSKRLDPSHDLGRALLAAFAGVLLLASVGAAHAKPVMSLTMEDVVVQLHDEPCAIDAVGGGKYFRALWIDKGTPTEGCWGVARLPGNPTIICYFADRTIAALPAAYFTRVGES